MTKLEYDAVVSTLTRMKAGNETETDVAFLLAFPEDEIRAIIQDMASPSQAGKGKWNPDSGDVRSGRYYGKD